MNNHPNIPVPDIQNKIEQLLSSKEKQDQIDGLNLLAQECQYGFFLQAVALTHCMDRETADLALRVSIYIAEKYLMDPRQVTGGTRLLWAKIILDKYRPEFQDEARRKLESADPNIQIQGLCGIRHFIDDSESLQLLKRFIHHPDHRVRATACTQIGLKATKASTNILMELLQDSDNRVIANAIETMDKARNPVFVEFFEKFKTDANNRIRANALVALFNCGRIDISMDLIKMLKSKNPLMRTSAVWAIGEIGKEDTRFFKLLKKVIKDKDELVQKNLVIACGKAGNIAEIIFLRKPVLKKHPELLNDPKFGAWKNPKNKHN